MNLGAGWNLASTRDAEENAALEAKVRDAGNKWTWIGFHQPINNTPWEWNDGTVSDWTNWYKNRPNDYLVEDCTHIWEKEAGKLSWNDHQCSYKMPVQACGMCKPNAPPIACDSVEYLFDETATGNKCTTACDCDGERTCSPYGWCQGMDGRDPTKSMNTPF